MATEKRTVKLPANKKICTRLRNFRLEKGLTQKQYAEKLNINISMIKHIENCNQLPTYEYLRAVHKKFKLSYRWVIDGKGE